MRQLQPLLYRAESFLVAPPIAMGFLLSDEGGLSPSIEVALLSFVGASY